MNPICALCFPITRTSGKWDGRLRHYMANIIGMPVPTVHVGNILSDHLVFLMH